MLWNFPLGYRALSKLRCGKPIGLPGFYLCWVPATYITIRALKCSFPELCVTSCGKLIFSHFWWLKPQRAPSIPIRNHGFFSWFFTLHRVAPPRFQSPKRPGGATKNECTAPLNRFGTNGVVNRRQVNDVWYLWYHQFKYIYIYIDMGVSNNGDIPKWTVYKGKSN